MNPLHRGQDQAILYAMRGRSGVTFDELLSETHLSRMALSQALFRLTDLITHEGGLYMPTGVYPRKGKAQDASPEGSVASAPSPTRRGRRPGRKPQEPDGSADYGAVLADLRTRREQIDAAITHLEALLA